MKEKRELSSKNFLRSSRFRVFYVPSKALTYLAVLSFFFLASFTVFNLFSPVTSSNAETDTNVASDNAAGGAISLATESNVSIDIAPTPDQKIYSKTTELSITNSCKKGATITLSTNKFHNNLERTGSDALQKTIAAVSGGGYFN